MTTKLKAGVIDADYIVAGSVTPLKLTTHWKANQIADGVDICGADFRSGPSNHAENQGILAGIKMEGE